MTHVVLISAHARIHAEWDAIANGTTDDTQAVIDRLEELFDAHREMVQLMHSNGIEHSSPLCRSKHLATLPALRRLLSRCRQCSRHAMPVLPIGADTASVAIITDVATDTPFSRGQIDALLKRLNLKRENVYLTLAVKCPLSLIAPRDGHGCYPWLRAEMRLLKPRHIITLGHRARNALSHAQQSAITS